MGDQNKISDKLKALYVIALEIEADAKAAADAAKNQSGPVWRYYNNLIEEIGLTSMLNDADFNRFTIPRAVYNEKCVAAGE